MTTNSTQQPPDFAEYSYLMQRVAGFQIRLKTKATGPCLLITLGSKEANNLHLAIDLCPLLKPASPAGEEENLLIYPIRLVISSSEYQSEFIEEPEASCPWVFSLIQEMDLYEGDGTAATLVLLSGDGPENFYTTTPAGKVYVDYMLKVPCGREELMEFVGIYRLATLAAFGGNDMLQATLSAKEDYKGGH